MDLSVDAGLYDMSKISKVKWENPLKAKLKKVQNLI